MLRCCRSRSSRASRSVLPVSPNSFSNTARGWDSIGSGCVGVRHETVCVYTQFSVPEQTPALAGLSIAISSEATCVCLPNSRASN